MPLTELLPWRSLTLETSWPPDVVATELRKRIGKKRWLGGTPEPFEGGWMNEREAVFSVSRSLLSRNSFRPIVKATIEQSHHNGSRVVVTMQLHVLVKIITVVWLTGACIVALTATLAAFDERNPLLVLGWLFPLSLALVLAIGFTFGARKAERTLREMVAPAPALPAPVESGQAFR